MRLFDKLVAARDKEFMDRAFGPIPTEVCGPSDAACPVLFADEIAKHFETISLTGCGPDEMPYATPPWGRSFVEWYDPSMPSGQRGALVFHTKDAELIRKAKFDLLSDHRNAKYRQQIQEMASRVHIYCFNYKPGSQACYCGIEQDWTLSDTGRILSVVPTGPGIDIWKTEYDVKSCEATCQAFTAIIGLAFTFANCANVKLEAAPADMAPTPKIQRRLKIPEVKRYTLNICGHTTNRRANTEPGQVGIMPWHLCRGHFATYTAERPRFGRLKDGVGRFWIEPHMRGKKDRGEIIKDYAITDPKGPKYGGESEVRQPVLDG